MVAVSTIKMADGKVFCETPEGTVINININQRSCMDGLLDAIKKVSFMTFGFISVMLAISLAVIRPELDLAYVGTHFWVGFPFLVAGALNVLAYKYPSALWIFLAFISLFGCLAVSIAGLVFAAIDIGSFSWRSMADLCDNVLKQNNYYYITAPPVDDYGTYWILQRCKSEFQEYEKVEENDDPLLSPNLTQDIIIA